MIWLDHGRKCVWRDGMQILLPPRQFALCAYLASAPGVIRTRAEIMDAVGIGLDAYEKAVDSLVKHTRKRGLGNQIGTRQRYGYYWREDLIG